jgi:5'-3' exonuclease
MLGAMTSDGRTLMLLDTASLYFRAFYGVPDTMVAPDGSPVNAVRGLLDFIARLVTDHSPAQVVACWDDDWRPEFRVAAIPSYKAHRVLGGVDEATGRPLAPEHALPDGDEEVPDLLSPQVPVIVGVLEALGIPVVGAPGYEADDIIGTLATRAAGPVDVVTGDRDLFQLVDDARGVRILYTARGVSRADQVDEAWVQAKYGIPGRSYAAFAALRGDPSDGLPGVRGVGEKTAASLVREHGDVPGVLAAAKDRSTSLGGAVRANILAAEDYLAVAPTVVDVVRDIDLPVVDGSLHRLPAHPERLEELAVRWGLESSVARVLAAASAT